MAFRKNVGVGYGAFWRGIIFDVEYKNFEDIVAKSEKWFPKFKDGCEFLRSAKDYKWVWPTGEELHFRTGSTKLDYQRYHGHEYCLAETERVRTSRGLVEIRFLRVGDMALTPVGYRRVNRVFDVGVKDCVKVGGQVQSVEHRLLSDDGSWDKTAACVIRYNPDERCLPFNFNHPYTGISISCLFSHDSIGVSYEPCGKHRCIDIEVDDVNCYITESGLLNKNCFIGFNELTKQPNRDFYDAIRSCNRSSFIPEVHSPDKSKPLPPIPLVTFCTTNPHGPGHNWVKSEFIDAGEPGEIVKKVVRVYSAKTKKEEDVVLTKCHMWSSWRENHFLPETYAADLSQNTNEAERAAWFDGNWNITSGGALDDIWDSRYLRVPRFKVPAHWRIDRSFDWGSTVPFYCAWWAEADGSEVEVVLPDGKSRWWGPAKGSLVMFHEWYGGTNYISNEGMRLGPNAVAIGISAREKLLRREGWIVPEVKPGPADNQIHNSMDTETDSIAKRMALPPSKIRWTESDKKPGSRKNGLQLMRDMIEASKSGEGKGIFFMDHCQAALNILPALQRDPSDPDDAATNGIDHPWDAVRYRILDMKPNYAKTLDANWYGTQSP